MAKSKRKFDRTFAPTWEEFKRQIQPAIEGRKITVDQKENFEVALFEVLWKMQLRLREDPDAPSWHALCKLLMTAKDDPIIAKSKGVCDCIDSLLWAFGDWPTPGSEFEKIAATINKERAAGHVRNKRGDQLEKDIFQQWLRDSGIKLERIVDVYEQSMSNEVLKIVHGRNTETLRRWYKEINPGRMKPGRKA